MFYIPLGPKDPPTTRARWRRTAQEPSSTTSRAGSLTRMLRRGLRPLATFATMFALLCGGPFGTEEIVPNGGPGLAIVMLIAMAIFWALHFSLLVGELASAMPLQGGVYQWFRASLGSFGSLRLCQQIPPPGMHLTRLYSAYANRTRGARALPPVVT